MYIPRNRSQLLPTIALEDYSLPLPLCISSDVGNAKYHSIVMGNKLSINFPNVHRDSDHSTGMNVIDLLP